MLVRVAPMYVRKPDAPKPQWSGLVTRFPTLRAYSRRKRCDFWTFGSVFTGGSRSFSSAIHSHRPDGSRKIRRLFKHGDIMLHLWEFLEESGLHGPILEVVYVFQEYLRYLVPVGDRIMDEDVAIGPWPVEVEVLDECCREGPCGSVLFMLEDKTVTEAWPGRTDCENQCKAIGRPRHTI